MGGGRRDSGFCAGNFLSKRFNAQRQFFNREIINILPYEKSQRIGGVFGKKFIQVHKQSVDRNSPAVNKPRGQWMAPGKEMR